MRRNSLSLDALAAGLRRGRATGAAAVMRASAGEPEIGAGRTVRYVLSTPVVARDMHTIAADAWETANYLRNPVFLWAHDDRQPPIGRMVELGTVGDALMGTVEYAERDLNPFADTVYQLVRARYLNAVSVSWGPIQYRVANDKARPGGVDFTKVDLFEVSQVPVPANPEALAEARRAGIDTAAIAKWAAEALDRGAPHPIPRGRLEVLRRAASATGGAYFDFGASGVAARRRRAAQIAERVQSDDRAARYRAGGELDSPAKRLAHALALKRGEPAR